MWKKKNNQLSTDIFTNFRKPKSQKKSDIWLRRPFPVGTQAVIGHRGSSLNYPENTMLSFRKAVEEGAHGIETDIFRSADGKYVCMHDSTVDRTTDHSGWISNYTYDQLKNMDAGSWKGEEFEGREDTKVPGLIEVLDEYKDKPIFIMLHIHLIEREYVYEIIDLLENRNQLNQCFIFIYKSALLDVKNYNPKAFVMNGGNDHSMTELTEQAKEENWDAVSNGLSHYQNSIQALESLKNNKILTQLSTITNNFEEISQIAIDLGVTFLLVDDVKICVRVLEEYNGMTQMVPMNFYKQSYPFGE